MFKFLRGFIVGASVLGGVMAGLILIYGFLVAVPAYLLVGHTVEAIVGLTLLWIVFWFSILFAIFVDE